MILQIEPSLVLIDDILGDLYYGLYHISSREKLASFGVIKDDNGNILNTLNDVFNCNTDILGLDDSLIISKSECDVKTLSDKPFYSIIGFKIFKDILEYKLYTLNQYKDFVYNEPIMCKSQPYYPEYFIKFNGYTDDISVLRYIVRRYSRYEIDEMSLSKVIQIINSILNGINYKLFSKNNIYRVSGESYHVYIEDLGNIFELRYRDILMDERRIIP